MVEPGLLVLEREAATALLVAKLVAQLANLRLEGAILSLLAEITLICILILPRYRLQSANLVDVLHATAHLGIGQRALTTATPCYRVRTSLGNCRGCKSVLHLI